MKHYEQDQAYNLYFQTQLTHEQIADILKVNRKTIHLWAKAGNWAMLKKSAESTPAILVEQCYYQLNNLNTMILNREWMPYPTEKESDIMRRLTLTIKQLKTTRTVSESMECMLTLAERIRGKDPDLANALLPYIEEEITCKADQKIYDTMLSDYIYDEKEEHVLTAINPDWLPDTPPPDPFLNNENKEEAKIETPKDTQPKSGLYRNPQSRVWQIPQQEDELQTTLIITDSPPLARHCEK